MCAVTKASRGIKIAEEQILAKQERETTLWSLFLLFYFSFQDPVSLIAAFVVQTCPKTQPLPLRSFLYQ